jgi:hypothetical protein
MLDMFDKLRLPKYQCPKGPPLETQLAVMEVRWFNQTVLTHREEHQDGTKTKTDRACGISSEQNRL